MSKSPNRPTTRAGRAAFKGTLPHGGAQKGSGRKPVFEEATILLHRLSEVDDEKAKSILTKLRKSNFRIPETADEGTKELVDFCRAKLMQILIYPTRHAQSQVVILKMFLEEACGKVPDQVRADQNIKVEIVKSAAPAAAPPATEQGAAPELPEAAPLPMPTITRLSE
jgi:hypothetical protein